MKIQYTFLLFWFGLLSLSAQNELYVSPTFEQGNDKYSDLQAAVDAATSGDIIYIYPGGYAGTITVNKSLSLIGRGYRIAENYPAANTSLSDARIATLVLEEDADNSLVQGMKIDRLKILGADDCLVARNYLEGLLIMNATSATVRQNYLLGESKVSTGDIGCSNSYSRPIVTSNNGDLIIKNNILKGFSYIILWEDRDCAGAYTANIDFQHNYSQGRIFFPPTSIYVANNQIATLSSSTFYLSIYDQYGVIKNNVGKTNIIMPSGNNNISSWNSEFSQSGNSFDAQYQLLPTAESKNYATDGGDVGPFGGTNPYKLSGVTALPFIYQLNVPDEATTGGGMPVSVKVKTGN